MVLVLFHQECQMLEDGTLRRPNKRTVGRSRAASSKATQAEGRKRTSVEGQSGRAQRSAVDTSNGSTMVRSSGTLSVVSDMLPKIRELGEERGTAEDFGKHCGGLVRSRKDRSRRMFRGCDFRRRKKRGLEIGKTRCGKGSKVMAVADAHGLPIAIHVRSASPNEVTLVHETLGKSFLADAPRRLIGDCAYDSDRLDESLADEGIELIAPHRKNRVQITQDGRAFRRYKRRWKVERLFAWLKNFRRISQRWERNVKHFLGFVDLACMLILMRRYL